MPPYRKKRRTLLAEMHPYARQIIRISLVVGCFCCLCAILALLLLPHSPAPLTALTGARALLATAPTMPAAGVSAAVLCDLMYRQTQR